VWERFAESPAVYVGITEALRRAPRPFSGTLSHTTGTWPQENDEAEAALRVALGALHERDPPEARSRILALEAEHGARRASVWATLGKAPLAHALAALARLAEATATPLSGGNVAGVVAAYTAGGWEADAAALTALAAVTDTADVLAVKGAVRALYMLWLRDAAELFAAAVREDGAHYVPPPRVVTAPTPGVCILFADGLRFDMGKLLVARLTDRGLTAAISAHLAALPPVTPTAKPAVSPVAGLLAPGTDFDLTVATTGQKVSVEVLRQQLTSTGYTVLRGEETGDGTGAAWTESGALDAYGHAQGWKLARRVQEEAGELADRIAALLAAGWREVRVVTDHGWLLLPGGLPKAEIPVGITDARKGRCARLKGNALWEGQMVPWYWDADVQVAVAPGISCFEAGKEYEHGSLSPQECIVPTVTVTANAAPAATATITGARWTGLRCRVMLDGKATGCTVDIRTKAGDVTSSVVQSVKSAGEDGTAVLFVPDDDCVKMAAFVVLTDARGIVLHQSPTTIGG